MSDWLIQCVWLYNERIGESEVDKLGFMEVYKLSFEYEICTTEDDEICVVVLGDDE